MAEDAQEKVTGEVGVLSPTEEIATRHTGAATAPAGAGAAPAQLALEEPWHNPEPWWLRGGVRPYLLLGDVAAFGIATAFWGLLAGLLLHALEAGALRRAGDSCDRGLGVLLVGDAAPVQGGDRLLVLEADAQAAQTVVVVRGREGLDLLRPALQLAVGLGTRGPRAQDLAAVGAEVGDRPQRDDPARVGGSAPRHAGHHPVALGDLDQRAARRLVDVGVLGLQDDRSQHAVDVEQDG